MSRLLHPNPATRLTVAELSSHLWFKRSLSLDSQLWMCSRVRIQFKYVSINSY